MPFYKNSIQLTPREMEIMNILWGSEEPLHASQVASVSGLSINTVNAVVKKLLNSGIIEVADITHSGTVLSRRYRPMVSHQEYATNTFITQLKAVGQELPTPQIVATLLEQEDDEAKVISSLEKMLKERKKKLQGGT